ncbi:DUF2157 domain-containing protein [Wolbachia endosymbiont of Cylisticus convexus]|nr:DUF2157 domain-containing protein [Wolbachia endosymbiont of Cylisticus convexus]
MVSFIVAALDILFYASGAYSKIKWPEKFYSNNGLLFLGVLFTPCAILIFFAALHGNEIKPDIIGRYFLNVTLISCILYVILGILLKSKLIWCFALIALEQWVSLLGENGYWLEMSLNVRLMLYEILLTTLSKLIKRNARISFLHRTTLVTICVKLREYAQYSNHLRFICYIYFLRNLDLK